MLLKRFNFSIWDTKPWQILDLVLWWLLKIFWEPWSLKRSHWWHWQIRTLAKNAEPLSINTDLNIAPRNTAWSNFWQTNFGWKNVALLTIEQNLSNKLFVDDRGVLQEYSNCSFQIGWNKANDKKFADNQFEICTIVLKNPKFAVLLGPGTTNFYAQDLAGNPLKLGKYIITTKKEALRMGYQVF